MKNHNDIDAHNYAFLIAALLLWWALHYKSMTGIAP